MKLKKHFFTFVEADEKTSRKWIKVTVSALSDFNLVSLKIYILE